jgi:hypothetical protein
MSNGPVQLAMGVAWNSEDMRQPPEVMTVPDEFHAIIGRIITQWGVLEQELEVITFSLMTFRGSVERGWHGLPFRKRWESFTDQWKAFASGNAELMGEFAEIVEEKNRGKYVRDCISHKRIAPGIADGRPFLRFQNENKGFPWTKKFHIEDLAVAGMAISSTAGRLFRLTNLDFVPFLSSESRSLLQRLPDMGHLRFPMPKGRRPQTPPFRL